MCISPEFLLDLIWQPVLFVPVRLHNDFSQRHAQVSEVVREKRLF